VPRIGDAFLLVPYPRSLAAKHRSQNPAIIGLPVRPKLIRLGVE
jgi:hypothetical protein